MNKLDLLKFLDDYNVKDNDFDFYRILDKTDFDELIHIDLKNERYDYIHHTSNKYYSNLYHGDFENLKSFAESGYLHPDDTERYLKDFDLSFCKSVTKKQFKQLSELTWIDGMYNLVLSGPPGVGKTHLAIALGYRACEEGYNVSYSTMQYLVQCLRTEEIDRRSRAKMNRIRKSNLLIIDEVGYLPINPTEGNLFFQLISELQEQTSIIITTNKGFDEWTEFLNDPALATAILDRLSFRCDRIKISGKSYRLENRQSFLNNGGREDEV